MDSDEDGVDFVAETPDKGKRPGTLLQPLVHKKARALLDKFDFQKYDKKLMKPAAVYAELTRCRRKFEEQGYVVHWPGGQASGEQCWAISVKRGME